MNFCYGTGTRASRIQLHLVSRCRAWAPCTTSSWVAVSCCYLPIRLHGWIKEGEEKEGKHASMHILTILPFPISEVSCLEFANENPLSMGIVYGLGG